MDFLYINISLLTSNIEKYKKEFNEQKPFRFLSFQNILTKEGAELLSLNFPTIESGNWDNTTYIHQRNKFQKSNFDDVLTFQQLFKELNSNEFISYIEQITGINDLKGDDELFGGGLHQSIKGAFLDVHVDYNFHPTTNYHRRLNIIIYMNDQWEDEWEGHLELWDYQKKLLLAKIPPELNTCVIFETNEVSFHGHPHPLKTPNNITRKSIAAYYYTVNRPESEIFKDHNTIYINTQGFFGKVKNAISATIALFERLKK